MRRWRLWQSDDVCVLRAIDITYTFGLSTNEVLKRESEALLAEAGPFVETTSEPQRMFDGFWYRARSWAEPRWVVVKSEANAHGTNRRFVVTNRLRARLYPEATYDEYVMRGESETATRIEVCWQSIG